MEVANQPTCGITESSEGCPKCIFTVTNNVEPVKTPAGSIDPHRKKKKKKQYEIKMTREI